MQDFIDDNQAIIESPILPANPTEPFRMLLKFVKTIPLSKVDLTNFEFAPDCRLSVYNHEKGCRVDVAEADVPDCLHFKEVRVIFDKTTKNDAMLAKMKIPAP